MAKIKFLLQSKGSSANIYLRYSISREISLKRKTGFIIDNKNWSEKESLPIGRDEHLKKLKSDLTKLRLYVEDAFNLAAGSGIELTGQWLQEQIDSFNNKAPVKSVDILTNYIDKYIHEAPLKTNQKKALGLSNSRVQNLKLFKTTIQKYQAEALHGKSIILKNINLQFVEKYKIWLFNKGYSINYVGKNISNLKTICNDAFKNDVEVSPQIKNFRTVSETRPPEEVIYLSDDDQEIIKETILFREALINARKWLLLGCLIGQRGGDLLAITEKNIKELSGIKIVELRQKKTGKLVAIPLLPDALEIVESGLPYRISLVKFNEYIKEICKAANLDTIITGRKKEHSRGSTTKGSYAKHELISSHTCRRSFATNFYGKIPTPILMNITGHGSEKVFLAYIGKTTYDNAYQMVDYFSKLAPRSKNNDLKIVFNSEAII